MQLLVLIALLLSGGNADNLLKEVQPLLKNLGGKDMQNLLKQAEEIYGIVTAMQGMGGNSVPPDESAPVSGMSAAGSGKNGGFALAPIAAIADENIICRMTKYIADNA